MTNKPYFAKYLPIDEEIKEGDRTFEVNGNLLPHTVSKDELAYVNSMGDKKAKLFLCLRDLQIGDKIYLQDRENEYEQGYYILGEEVTPRKEGDKTGTFGISWISNLDGEALGEIYIDDCFKVIGEISPDALSYVKDGQEFDEDEWRMMAQAGNSGWLQVDRKADYTGIEHYVYIKGPCCHFH